LIDLISKGKMVIRAPGQDGLAEIQIPINIVVASQHGTEIIFPDDREGKEVSIKQALSNYEAARKDKTKLRNAIERRGSLRLDRPDERPRSVPSDFTNLFSNEELVLFKPHDEEVLKEITRRKIQGKIKTYQGIQRYLGQAMTDEQQRNYNTAMSGIALELAYVLNGGYKPNEGQINKLETLLAVGPNDTYGNAAYKFSDVTAKLKAAVDVSPTYTDEQKATKQMLLDKMNRYATPEQVQDRIYGPGKAEEPAVRAGNFYEPQTDADFNDIPGGELYKDPADGKIYRKKKQ